MKQLRLRRAGRCLSPQLSGDETIDESPQQVAIDETLHCSEHLGNDRPLVDQDKLRKGPKDSVRIGTERGRLRGVVETTIFTGG